MSTSVLRLLKPQGAWSEQEPAGFSPNEVEGRGQKAAEDTPASPRDTECRGAHVGPARPGMSVSTGDVKSSWPRFNTTLGISWFEQHPGCYLAPSLILTSPISTEAHSPKIILG